MKDIKYPLEVALAVFRISCKELARRWEVTDTHIWNVARGVSPSEKIREKIEVFITKAQDEDPLLKISKSKAA